MKNQNVKIEELKSKTRTELINIIKDLKIEGAFSRTSKDELVEVVSKSLKPTPKKKEKKTPSDVNKSDLLRKEIRRRIRAKQELNSGELVKFMKETHKVTMSRQFIINVKNRFLTACPELLSA